MDKRVLIFPAGSEIGSEIRNSLMYQKYIEIYGGTSVKDHTDYLYKNVVKLPFIDEPDFIEQLNAKIEENGIDFIFPAYDQVQCFLMENESRINATIISSENEVVALCRDKQKTYEYLDGEKYVPAFFQSVKDVREYPVFVKPRVGQGSEDIHVAKTQEELDALLHVKKGYVICEYLAGKEYTIDCFTNKAGQLMVVKPRIRNRIRNGISVNAVTLLGDDRFQMIAENLNQHFHFFGAWFFQMKENKNGELKLLEVSPRVSGTMGLSRNSGINFAMLSLYLHMGTDTTIIDNQYEISVDRSLISRYNIKIHYENVYIDYDDTLVYKGQVNVKLMALIYQFKNKNKKVFLLSRHAGNLYDDLDKFRIDPKLFDEIIWVKDDSGKANYIANSQSIFIDDSFAERKKVFEKLKIPVFDLDSMESLIDWRM
jgi:predicted ATP-grasp superfamily ATP-dependent carboligase